MFDCLWYRSDLPFRVEANGGQMIIGVLAGCGLMVDPWNYLVVISWVPEWITGMDIFSNWQSPHICSVTGERSGKVVGNAWSKPLELLLCKKKKKNSKPKAVLNSWRYCRVQWHHQGFGNCRDGDFYHIPFQLICLAFTENRWIWRITVNYHKLNQNHSSY